MDPRGLVAAALASKLHERFVSRFTSNHPTLRNHADDLRQEAFAGIMRAADTFDPARGVAFETHAHWWMRHATRDYLRKIGRELRIEDAPTTLEEGSNLANPVDQIAAPEVEGEPHDQLDASKTWLETRQRLENSRPEGSPGAQERRRLATDAFMRSLSGESSRSIAAERGQSHQAIRQSNQRLLREFGDLFPAADLHAVGALLDARRS